MFSIEQLYAICYDLNDLSGKVHLESALLNIELPNDDAIGTILNLIEESRFEVEACNFRREEKSARYLDDLRVFRANLMRRIIRRDRGEVGQLFTEGALERLNAISDAVTENLEAEPKPIGREMFSEATTVLLKEVQGWQMDEFAKRSLLLSIGLVNSQLNVVQTSVSDTDIRRRVCAIVAAFSTEFSLVEKEYQTWFETISRWAKLGYEGAPKPLGLTWEVMKALPKP